MNMILRNYFYAVGLTALFRLYLLDPDSAQFADLVRLVQSPAAFQMVLALTATLAALDFYLSLGYQRASAAVGSSSGAATATGSAKSSAAA